MVLIFRNRVVNFSQDVIPFAGAELQLDTKRLPNVQTCHRDHSLSSWKVPRMMLRVDVGAPVLPLPLCPQGLLVSYKVHTL